ncbi:MAG TPA: 2-phospho-L-lactate guanylyltransferase [Terriglobales bacterium]|nr:2-phospho-L-lactate guanylyltransferase [Terriglobales bacterium]
MILIPIKNLATAKQRLASLLSQPVRTELAQAMLLDVFDAVSACANCPEVSVVTSDPFAIEAAGQFDFAVIADSANCSETDAIEMATRSCESRGVTSTLVIPADIPLIQSSELETVLADAPEQGSVLVPAADGRGTNAAFRRPAALFPLRFGNDSFKPHLAAARATGMPCRILSVPGIGLDIDNPVDLRQLAELRGDTRSQRLARQWDLTDFSIAANE